jgi:hypothetical protein
MTVTELIEALTRLPGDHSLRTVDVQIIDDDSGFVRVDDVVWDGLFGSVTLVPSRRLTVVDDEGAIY